ncbi:MAG: aminotransferase class I/II-fold pyridoxal phosphate-dependent enzyme [Pirellulales bacterium]|nr:aminotransferase class I/II-fold pyridoxal phosphate-dependent enzyme [Pirellulales bacterium]
MGLNMELDETRQRMDAAYDPELFRTAGHRMVDLLADHLAQTETAQRAVLPWCNPPENVLQADRFLEMAVPKIADRDALANHFAQLVQTMLARGLNLHDPRYIGHQVPASVPVGGLFDGVGAVTNQVMAIYDMGPWATSIERALVYRLGRQIGWSEPTFSGLVTHGGSLANLTALLTARNVRLGDVWERGALRSGLSPVILVHADAHYSVTRSAGILGLGTGHVLPVPPDDRRRMDPNRLDEMLRNLRAKNQPVVAVVACACATPIGAFDPLEAISDVCRRHDVWLHVDAAHGGAACFSPRYRHLVAGLDRADSIIWDAHKMLFVPALCAFVFYRCGAHQFETFRQDAPYLFDPAAPGLAEYDSGLRTIECTKRAAAFGLWGIWSLFGSQLFNDLVDITFSMGRVFYEKLAAAPDFEPLHEPECNIVVFRYVPEPLREAPVEQLGRFQLDLRRRLIESGDFYIVSTNLNGAGALRVTIINPRTEPEHLDRLMDAIRKHGRALLDSTDSRAVQGSQ